MQTVYDYSRPIDESGIMLYRFDDTIKALIASKVIFETEESNAAPEPSIASRVRASNNFEYALIYLQASKQLLVLSEAGADTAKAIETFAQEMPELSPFRLPYTVTPIVPYSPE